MKGQMRRLLLWIFGIIPVLVAGVGTAFFSALSNEALVMACVDPVFRQRDQSKGPLVPLPPQWMCSYLKTVRDPDPNVRDSKSQKTLFGFTVSVFGNPRGERAKGLLQHFVDRGVQWDEPHSGLLTPLHLAVFYRSEPLVKRFLTAGANPRTPLSAPGRLIDGLDAFDFARFLRTSGSQELNPRTQDDDLQRLHQLESLLCDDPSVNTRASIQKMPTVSIPSGSHRMLGYGAFDETYIYAADNAEQIPLGRDPIPPPPDLDPLDDDGSNGVWGGVSGPLGDQSKANFGFSSVWDFITSSVPCDAKPGSSPSAEHDECALDILQGKLPSSLEANLGVQDPEMEEGGFQYSALRIHSRQSRPEKPARLLRLESLSIEDVDKDGQFEVRARAQFAIGCHGKPYSEDFILEVRGPKMRVLEPAGKKH